MSYQYQLTYKIGRKEKEDIKPEEGACDAFLFASILYPPDGSLSVLFVGADGREGHNPELDDNEWFKVWAMLSTRLANSKTLGEGKKKLCATAFEIFTSAIAEVRNEKKSI